MSAPRKKKRITRSLAELVPGAMGEALAAQGFAGGEILLRWADIAGPELARRSEPLKLAWPRGAKAANREPGTLHVRVDSAFALELQMQSTVIMERINRYFGWRCVGAVKLKQGPVGPRREQPRSQNTPLPVEKERRIAEAISGIADEKLTNALQRLGRAIASGTRSEA